MSPLATQTWQKSASCPSIFFLNLREKVSFKRHAQRFEGDSFKDTRSVLRAPRLKFSEKVLAQLSV